VERWLGTYGECNDGHIVVMSEDTDCGDHDGFKTVLPADFEPQAGPNDIALCANGTYSDNTDLRSTCSANGGVAEWLATFAECSDGSVIELSTNDPCSGHGGFKRLMPVDYQPPVTSPPTTTLPPTTLPPPTLPPTTTLPPAPSLTPSQQGAIRSAESYLRLMAFSRQGLIDQLSSEYGDQFSVEDATFAVDSLNVDWFAEAVESAESYVDLMGFSCQGLIDQLSSEFGDQFTVEEATHGATQVGLC
jgi:hypothetical protein